MSTLGGPSATATPAPDLSARLGHEFAHPELLEQALTHTSYTPGRSNDRSRHLKSNERLEFLGDRVLGLVIADMLMVRFPQEAEGALAPRHVALVRREALARVALAIELGRHMHMGKSDAEAGGLENPGILANCCEAVIAALYHDGGLDAARRFIERYWDPMLNEELTPPKDSKTRLQEWAQKRGKALPAYGVIERAGPAHAPMFTVELTIDGQGCVQAQGASKRVAEQAAAGLMLKQINQDQEIKPPNGGKGKPS